MQKVATRVFVYASLAFGVIGILLVLTMPGRRQQGSDVNIILMRLLMVCVFIILPSFALSVAGKYLGSKK